MAKTSSSKTSKTAPKAATKAAAKPAPKAPPKPAPKAVAKVAPAKAAPAKAAPAKVAPAKVAPAKVAPAPASVASGAPHASEAKPPSPAHAAPEMSVAKPMLAPVTAPSLVDEDGLDLAGSSSSSAGTSVGATGSEVTSAGVTTPGAAPSSLTAPDAKPQPPRPSRPPAPVTGTAAMKNLAQRNAAALRPPTDPSDMSGEAQRILTENDSAAVLALGDALAAEKQLGVTCKILDDVLAAKPDLLVGLVDRFVVLIAAPQKRTVQTVAMALPVMARLAPARVARHLQPLTERFTETNEVGKDGLVSTFAALCMASVAYQKRLEPVLELALSTAEPKTLQRWAEIILPSLKGEPHARARAVVEGRLPSMPRPLAQPIATFLGIKLRPLSP